MPYIAVISCRPQLTRRQVLPAVRLEWKNTLSLPNVYLAHMHQVKEKIRDGYDNSWSHGKTPFELRLKLNYVS